MKNYIFKYFIDEQKLRGGFELIICGSDTQYFNHWPTTIYNLFEGYKQFN